MIGRGAAKKRGVVAIEPGKGTVYFVAFQQWGVMGLKVGCTGNLRQRMYALRNWLGPTARLLATMPGERAEELAVLTKLRDYRIRSRKPEYFFLTPGTLKFVGAVRAGAVQCP